MIGNQVNNCSYNPKSKNVLQHMKLLANKRKTDFFFTSTHVNIFCLETRFICVRNAETKRVSSETFEASERVSYEV